MSGDFLETDFDTMLNTDEFAVSATYIAYPGYETTINVIFDNERIVVDPYTGETERTPPTIYCNKTDVPNIRANKSQFVIDGVYYDVTKYDDDLGEMIITLQREDNG